MYLNILIFEKKKKILKVHTSKVYVEITSFAKYQILFCNIYQRINEMGLLSKTINMERIRQKE